MSNRNHFRQYDEQEIDGAPSPRTFQQNIIGNTNHTSVPGIQQPQEEGPSEGFPVFQRQTSFERLNTIGSQSAMGDVNQHSEIIHLYRERIKSFVNKWPAWSSMSTNEISKAGMRYIGPEDKVQCDYCRGILYSWDDGDIPLEEHQKHFPVCPFLEGRWYEVIQGEPDEGNVMITDNNITAMEDAVPVNIHNTQQPYGVSQFEACNIVSESQQSNDQSKTAIAIDIVKSIGYGDEIIEKALRKLSADSSQKEINSENLLDIIFELEDLMDNEAEMKSLEDNFTQHATINDICKSASSPCNANNQHMFDLQHEYSTLKQSVMCNICWKEKCGILFLPCRHIAACTQCGYDLKNCVKCSKGIVATVRIY